MIYSSVKPLENQYGVLLVAHHCLYFHRSLFSQQENWTVINMSLCSCLSESVPCSVTASSEVICLEHCLHVHCFLSDLRWSSKCGWTEWCELCVACLRRRPAKTWSLLWLRPLVSVSNSLCCEVFVILCYHTITSNQILPSPLHCPLTQIQCSPELSGGQVGFESARCPCILGLH